MKNTYPHITRSGSTVTIEARTVAEADAAAEAALGPGFSVQSVRRLRRGGVGGFFALELVELVATSGGRDEAGPEMASAEELLQRLQRNDGNFATRLLDRIGDVDEDVTIAQLFSTARAAGVPDSMAWEELIEPALRATPGYDAVPDTPGVEDRVTTRRDELPVVPAAAAPSPVDQRPPAVELDLAGPPLPSRAAARANGETARPRGGGPLVADHPVVVPPYPVSLPPRVAPPGSTGPLAEMPPRAMRFDEEQGRWVEDTSLPEGEIAPIAGYHAGPAEPSAEPSVDADLAPVARVTTPPPPPPPPAPATTPLPPPPPPPPVAIVPTTPAIVIPVPVIPVPVIPVPVTTAVPVAPAVPVAAAVAPTPAVGPAASFDTEPVAVAEPEPAVGTETVEPGPDPGSRMQKWLEILQTPEPVLGDAELGPASPPPVVSIVAARDALEALPDLGGPAVPTEPDPPRVAPGFVLSAAAALAALATDNATIDEDAGVDLFAGVPPDVLAEPVTPELAPTDTTTDGNTRETPADDTGAELDALGLRPGFRSAGLDALRPARRTTNWRARPLGTDDDGRLAGTVAAFTAPAVHVERAPDEEPLDPAEPTTAVEPVEPTETIEARPVPDDAPAAEPATVAPVGAPVEAPVESSATPVVATVIEPAPVPVARPVGRPIPPAPAPVEPPRPATFRTLLRDEPIVAAAGPMGDGWSPQALFAVGVPDRLVQTAAALDPRDDAEWTAALMLALRPLFAPLPDGRTLIAGPSIDALADTLGVPVLEVDEDRPTVVDDIDDEIAALATEDPAEITAGLHGRQLHLVIGGVWHELARLRPAVVSAAGPRFLLPALSVAHAWGVPLGYMGGVRTVRLDAVTVAMEIRATLGLDVDTPTAASTPVPPIRTQP